VNWQDVSNWILGSFRVRATQVSDQALVQHMRLDVGSGAAESVVTASNPLPVSSSASQYSVRVDEGATYTYIAEAAPGSLTSDAVWRVKRLTNATTSLQWAGGDAGFDKIWDDRVSLIYS